MMFTVVVRQPIFALAMRVQRKQLEGAKRSVQRELVRSAEGLKPPGTASFLHILTRGRV